MAPKWPIVGARNPTITHLRPKMAQHSFHMASARPQHRPTRLQLGSNIAATSLNMHSTWPNMAPPWPNMTLTPRWPNMIPTWPSMWPNPSPLPGRWQAVRRKPLNPAMPWQLAVRGDSAHRCSIATGYNRPTPQILHSGGVFAFLGRATRIKTSLHGRVWKVHFGQFLVDFCCLFLAKTLPFTMFLSLWHWKATSCNMLKTA